MKDRAPREEKWHQIVTEEEYIELFGTESDDKIFYGDWSEIGLESTEETPETQSVEDDSIEAAESDGTNEGEELQERNLTAEQQAIIFIIKEVLKSRIREALASVKVCGKRIVQSETIKVRTLIHHHHYHPVELARTCILSRHSSRSCIRAGRSSGVHSMSRQSWSM